MAESFGPSSADGTYASVMGDGTGGANGAVLRTASLGRWRRASCIVLGIGAGGAGAVAVFVAENEIGTGVLLAVGALFTLVGVTGNAPVRAKFGDSQFDFATYEERVGEILESAPEEVKPELAEVVREAAVTGSRLAAHADAILYEEQVRSAVIRVGARLGVDPVISSSSHDRGFDALVSHQGRQTAIIVKYTSAGPTRMEPLFRMLDRIRQVASAGCIVISNRDFTARAWANADEMTATQFPVTLVEWRTQDDDPKLEAALRKHLRSSPTVAS